MEHKAETVFRSPSLIGWTMIVMGAALALADWFSTDSKKITDLTAWQAVAIGIAQSLALIPGVSRSGVTITLALALGLRRTEAGGRREQAERLIAP